ncbi:WYL domain-containing protein [Citricoccus alkalitolerans]|uniref:Helix-turn-helix transcriptional regulator n=1 Tax=Citricoccus alkalitolerans TaxID=246603 RepID=A0ABV8Y0R3_9MICC
MTSTRTIQRDLTALHQLGVPVWTRTGPAGGVGLVDGWSSPITGMTASELQALLIGEAGSRDLGLHPHYETACLKMLGTTAAREPGVGSVSERFLIDHERWFAEPERPASLPVVSQAVWSGRRLRIEYSRGTRLVDPLGLVLKTDVWYLVAAHRRQTRTYRLSRIASAEIQSESAWRPEDFSLAAYWEGSRRTFQDSVRRVPVRLSLPASSLEVLREAVPGPGTESACASARRVGDRVELDLPMEHEDITVAQLVQVPGVEVQEPPAVRDALFRRGAELVARNRSTTPNDREESR